MLVAGLGLLVTTALTGMAGGGEVQRGGTLRLVYLQQLADRSTERRVRTLRATQLTLYTFADVGGDTSIRPAAAAGLPRVSADGKTFTITVRRGFRFSDGNACHCTELRLRDQPALQPEPGLALDVPVRRHRRGTRRARRKGRGRLGRHRPREQADHPSRAAEAGLARPTDESDDLGDAARHADRPGRRHDAGPSAGPYHLQEHVEGRLAVLTRNPFWRRKLLPWRPANVDRIVFERPGLTPKEAIEAVERDEIDLALAHGAPSEIPGLVSRYGVNRNRLFVKPRLTLYYLVFNLDRPLFRGNAKLRRAINYALDRPGMVRQFGPLVGNANRSDPAAGDAGLP